MPDVPVGPTLFLEFEGVSDEMVGAIASVAKECCDDSGGGSFQWATSESERRRLWAARHSTYYAALALRPGSRGIVTDAVVPISRLAEVMRQTADDVASSGVWGPIFGHAGDGNFHCILLVRHDDPPEYVAKLNAINERLMARTLAAGGSCTGEHGIGVGKKKYLVPQYGENTVESRDDAGAQAKSRPTQHPQPRQGRGHLSGFASGVPLIVWSLESRKGVIVMADAACRRPSLTRAC